MKKLTKTQIAIFLGWCFLHIILFSIGSGYGSNRWNAEKCKAEFWPFNSKNNTECFDDKTIAAYNITELLVYIGLPIMIYFILRLIKADEANKQD